MLVSSGVGFTDTTTFCPGELLQRFAVVIYTYVTMIGAVVVLVKVSLTLAVPLEAASAIPTTKALLQANVAPVVALVAI